MYKSFLNPEKFYYRWLEYRKNYIIRFRASNLSKQSHILAANLDQSMLYGDGRLSETSTTFMDRFCGLLPISTSIPVKIISSMNKRIAQ